MSEHDICEYEDEESPPAPAGRTMRITARILSGNRCTSPGADVYITEALAPSHWETWAAIHNIGAKAKRAHVFYWSDTRPVRWHTWLAGGYVKQRPVTSKKRHGTDKYSPV